MWRLTEEGILDNARYVESPNCDDRSQGEEISLLVVHGISLPPKQYGGPYIEQLFTNRLNPNDHPYFKEIATLKVSAHVLIRRDGELVQFVPFSKRAWHAGVSCFEGREKCNDFSIGIELEGCDDESYEPVQYEKLAKLTRCIMKAYPAVTPERIVGHCDIAPGRKTDPGPVFNWSHFRHLLSEED